MLLNRGFAICLAMAMLVCGWTVAATADERLQSRPRVFVHYMPWYATEQISGGWGWHWTMDHFDPKRQTRDGRREIASHDYPLIGPYDSSDPHAVECQVLLMKLAGIDGVIIDWYGTDDFRDYAQLHANTLLCIKWLKKAQLRFAICYEDQAIKHQVDAGRLKAVDAVAHAGRQLGAAAEQWFDDAAYLKIDQRPVLLVFGPQYFAAHQWKQLLGSLQPRPLLYGLPHLARAEGLDGKFGWPPVSGGREIALAEWRGYLRTLYDPAAQPRRTIGVVFPGFRDIYEQAGLHPSYGAIDAREGLTFAESLRLALESGTPVVQIATWNDYGEGTVIEPTRDYGYRYLEQLQRELSGSASTRPEHFKLPIELYRCRKRAGEQAPLRTELDRAAELMFAERWDEAAARLAEVHRRLAESRPPR